MEQMIDLQKLNTLTVEERLRVIEVIWDTLAADSQATDPTDAQRRELERRLAAHKASPHDVVPWEEVKAKALARVRP